MLRFEWDETKGRENLRKHRVGFDEAETVFYDERGVLIHDDDLSGEGGLPHVPAKTPGDSIDLRAEGKPRGALKL